MMVENVAIYSLKGDLLMIESILSVLNEIAVEATTEMAAATAEVSAAETAEGLKLASEAIERSAVVATSTELGQLPPVFQEFMETVNGASSLEVSRMAEVQEAKLRFKEVKQWLPEINPKFNPFRYTKYSYNCGSCAFAVEERLSGRNPGAISIPENIAPKDHMMELITAKKCEYMSPKEIEKRLKDIGPGSHLIVGITRSSGAGHWFNVYYDGENFHTLDGQSGKIYDWPHDYGNVTQWCAMV